MWEIKTTDTFDEWYYNLSDKDRSSVLAMLRLLRERGPMLPRPYADTVNDSIYPNMKELRVQSQGCPIRIFFAFDPKRTGLVLCGGDKKGNDKDFYDEMIPIADNEYKEHVENM